MKCHGISDRTLFILKWYQMLMASRKVGLYIAHVNINDKLSKTVWCHQRKDKKNLSKI